MFASVFHTLYVQDLSASTALYTRLLDRAPLESWPEFVMFGLAEGAMLGLWSRDTLTPPAYTQVGCGGELALEVADDAQVRNLYARWSDLRVTVLQEPTQLEFGFSFVVADGEGNRVRVYAPAQH